MQNYRGIIIHDTDCRDYMAARLEETSLNLVGIHPAGGVDSHHSLSACIRRLETPEHRAFLHRMEKRGIHVEYEMHALSWMLERERFDRTPEWFRMGKNGQRTPEFNCCVSNPDALDYIRERAAELARIFPSTTHRYHFWIDDVAEASCQCEACRTLSPSDQAMILYNAIAEGVQVADREAKQCYLAYCATLPVPETVAKRDNVFLEFAPFQRQFDKSLFDPTAEKNAGQMASLPALLDFFGKEDAKALDYWMDNSLFSGWKRPPKKFTLNPAVCQADIAGYRNLGFSAITSFGCFLGEDYRDLWGDADFKEYAKLLGNDEGDF